MTTRARRTGFTLIELLVVVGILAVLAALLFPVLSKARGSAQITTCSSNLHQIGLAVQMYDSDWGGLPPNFTDITKGRRYDELNSYTRNSEIYHCPSTFNKLLLRDYAYRMYSLREAGPERVLRPAPDTVILYCFNHVDRAASPKTGTYVALRWNGSVQRIPAGKVVTWSYNGGKWHPPGPVPPGDTSLWDVFPNEPWPPDFED
jgi:prepilin-type N-terminal cleavage/methylation domain-containing protein